MSIKPHVLLKLRIEGPGVHSGGIAVPDLIAICTHIQSAVNRQAEAMEGKPTLRRGPKTARIREECTLELVDLRKGSTILDFSLAKPQQPLPMKEVTAYGVSVVDSVVRTVKSLATTRRHPDGFDPGVLDSLKSLGDVFEKKTIRSIEWIVPRANGRKASKAVFTKSARDRAVELMKPPTRKELTIEGTLEMADFKEGDQKCRIHPPLGNPVVCTFEKCQEDDVYSLLRKPVRLTGEVAVNIYTGRLESVHVKNIHPIEPLALGAREFFAGRSFQQLAEVQGVKPLEDFSALAGGWPEDESLDDALEEIYSAREH